MKHFSIMVLVLAGLLLAACGGGGSGEAQPEASGKVTIEMSEYKFSPDTIELRVGQKAEITLVNQGEKDHEVMFGRDAMIMDGVPSGYQHDLFEGAEPMVMMGGEMADMEAMMAQEAEEGMGHSGFMVIVPPGSDTFTLTFDVTEDMVGEWEMGCFEDDGQHYDEGMKGKLVVKE